MSARGNDVLPVPLESDEQIALFVWAGFLEGRWPELALMYHIPNGGKRGRAEAARFRAEGVKAGVPDICLPVARGGCHGLYIELKRERGSRIQPSQTQWIEDLSRQGYCAAICCGWECAAELIERYLRGEVGPDAEVHA